MDLIQAPPAPSPSPPNPRELSTRSQRCPSQRSEVELKDGFSTRKMQKAGREKRRRDQLNEQFVELGNVVDPSRPKNDKATILVEAIQVLKDLTSQIHKLKAESAILMEESRELTQEKNDLREEKASLKSDIENLNIQYQQRVRGMFPWAPMDHTIVMAPPSYQFPVQMPMPPAPIPMHPSLQPYPFFGNQNPGLIPNPCSTFVPYVTPNALVEQHSTQHVSPLVHQGHRSTKSGEQDSKNRLSGESKTEKREDSNDVTTDLELKTPGSTEDQDLSSGRKNSKMSWGKENSATEGSSSSRCSSSCSTSDSSSGVKAGPEKVDA